MAIKLRNGLNAVRSPVIMLPSKQQNLDKFSIRSTVGHQFVHMFQSNVNGDVYVKCCSGICQSQFSKKKNVIHLNEDRDFCPHLERFKEYLSENRHNHAMLTTSGSLTQSTPQQDSLDNSNNDDIDSDGGDDDILDDDDDENEEGVESGISNEKVSNIDFILFGPYFMSKNILTIRCIDNTF